MIVGGTRSVDRPEEETRQTCVPRTRACRDRPCGAPATMPPSVFSTSRLGRDPGSRLPCAAGRAPRPRVYCASLDARAPRSRVYANFAASPPASLRSRSWRHRRRLPWRYSRSPNTLVSRNQTPTGTSCLRHFKISAHWTADRSKRQPCMAGAWQWAHNRQLESPTPRWRIRLFHRGTVRVLAQSQWNKRRGLVGVYNGRFSQSRVRRAVA